jgi:signal transduction histidine kinase
MSPTPPELPDRPAEGEKSRLLRRERNRIAGILHDTVEQGIFLIGVRLTVLLDRADSEPPNRRELEEIRDLAIASSDDLRRAVLAVVSPGPEGLNR